MALRWRGIFTIFRFMPLIVANLSHVNLTLCVYMQEPAQRTSKHRPKGTLVTKSINVDRTTMRSYFISKLLPSIVARWPMFDRERTIWIQQDNARTHVPPNDLEFQAAVAQTGLDIQIFYQPSNSPDMNILDLGFFSSL